MPPGNVDGNSRFSKQQIISWFPISMYPHAVISPTPMPLWLSIKNLCMKVSSCDMLSRQMQRPRIPLQRIEKMYISGFPKKADPPAPIRGQKNRRATP